MNWEIILTLTGIMLFAYWINYAMGSPLATKREDVDPKAILFWLPSFLGDRRLNEYGLYEERQKKLREELELTKDKRTAELTVIDARLEDFLIGRKLFTWERSLLCPICLHWWLSVLMGVVYLWFDIFDARADFLQAALTYLVLHLIIRKIS